MPPTGEDRFKPPAQIPYVQWFDLHIVWNATQFIHTCFQPKITAEDAEYLESESCLFVNIFTPGKIRSSEGQEYELSCIWTCHGFGQASLDNKVEKSGLGVDKEDHVKLPIN